MKTHHTSSKGTILIAQMDDNHLMNTIKLHASKIENGLTSLDKLVNLKPSEKILYGINNSDTELEKNIASDIHIRTQALQYYVFEACLRGLEVTEILQETFNRDKALPMLNTESPKLLCDDDFDVFNENED
jgi:hypothetical protein